MKLQEMFLFFLLFPTVIYSCGEKINRERRLNCIMCLTPLVMRPDFDNFDAVDKKALAILLQLREEKKAKAPQPTVATPGTELGPTSPQVQARL